MASRFIPVVPSTDRAVPDPTYRRRFKIAVLASALFGVPAVLALTAIGAHAAGDAAAPSVVVQTPRAFETGLAEHITDTTVVTGSASPSSKVRVVDQQDDQVSLLGAYLDDGPSAPAQTSTATADAQGRYSATFKPTETALPELSGEQNRIVGTVDVDPITTGTAAAARAHVNYTSAAFTSG